MKRIISAILAVVIVLSCVGSVSAYGADKVDAESKLQTISKSSGYIPGKTAVVTGNCYLFVSKVCEKLYGVKYDGEGLYSNYLARHGSGNYYTVKTMTIKDHTTTTATDAKNIRDFFLKYAQPGDIIHYGAYTTSTSNSNTHTFMIYHIDDKMMRIYHSNYEIPNNYSKNDCHIDDLYWDSLIKNPTKSIYSSDGSLYSLNSIFYNKMKSKGLGISINRYSKYNTYFNNIDVTAASADNTADQQEQTSTTEEATTTQPIKPDKVTGLATTSVNKETIGIKWDKAPNAVKYYISISNDTKGTTFSKTVDTETTTLNGLTVNNTYTIRVRGVSSTGTNGAYSDPITVKTVSPIAKTSGVEITACTTTSISLKWKKVSGAEKYQVYVKNNTKGSTFSKVVTGTTATLNNLTRGNVYTINVRAYAKADGYGTFSSAVKGCAKPAKPTNGKSSSPAKSKIKVVWKKVPDSATGYQIYLATDSKFTKDLKKVSVTGQSTLSKTVTGLKSGKKYYIKVRAYKTVDSVKYYGAFSSVVTIKCK